MNTLHTTASTAGAVQMAASAGITVDPTPIPGLEDPLRTLAGYFAWSGYAIALLAVVAGLAGLAGTVFLGWHMGKKLVGGILIALVAGFMIGNISAIIAGWIRF